MAEIWKPVVGWRGFYAVSNRGRVKSLQRVITRSNGRKMTILERILHAPPNANGYPHVSLHRPGKMQSAKVHELVARAFLGKRPQGLETRHLDGDAGNPRLGNLWYGTPGENGVDKIVHGRSTRGVKNPKAKLTEDQVMDIRRRYATRVVFQKTLALEYDVAPSTISMIVGRTSWAWL